MNYKSYCMVSGALLALVALAHLLRLLYGLPVNVEGYEVPMLFSWIGLIVPATLAAWAFRVVRG